jgi:presequence protease
MFTLVSKTEFPARRLTALRYRHTCGMEVLSLEAADPENLFALCFSTEPTNDTGVAHIIEHSVLEGSQRYPVKDPFVCMLKSSVATFINAMTYPDRTIYPCTTCCERDYFNLFDVYWDAVFHPNLKRETFLQEGWHYELGGTKRKPQLKLNGIVFNEMSGYYSDPGTILGREIEHALFNHTYMRYDSGGFPKRIPNLSYRGFKQFHQQHYNPAVTKVVLYGDIPTEKKLAYIEAQLAQTLPAYAGIVPFSHNTKSFREVALPAYRRVPFVPDPASKRAGTGIVSVAWRLDEATSRSEDDLGIQLLECVLLGSSGAPLMKALMDSHIGTSLMGAGYDNETRFLTFGVGMRGVKPGRAKEFETLVMDTLRKCVEEGLDAQLVKAAVSAYRIENQQISSKHLLDLLEDVMASWCYSDDPFFFIRQSEALPRIRELLDAQPRYFEELIQRYLLDNPARVCIEMIPDNGLQAREKAEREESLATKLTTLSEAQTKRIAADMLKLKQNALQPDTPEALATLPKLTRSDMPAKAPEIPYEDGVLANGLPFRRGKLFANGLSSMTAIGDLSGLPLAMQTDMSAFAAFFNLLGNEQYSYDAFSRLLASLGVAFSLGIADKSLDNGEPTLTIVLGCAGLDENFPQALELFRLQLDHIIFTERARLRQSLRAAASSAAAHIVTRSGLSRCKARCKAGLLPNGELKEAITGFGGYERLQKLANCSDSDLDAFAESMRACAAWLRSVPLVACGFLGSDANFASAAQFLQGFACQKAPLGVFQSAYCLPKALTPATGRHEYLQVETQVACCCRVIGAQKLSERDGIALSVVARILSAGYLWDAIRVKGGAYMVRAKYSRNSGSMTLCSGDDPQPNSSFAAFASVIDQLHSGALLEAHAVDEALIACLGNFLRPIYPADMSSSCATSLAYGHGNDHLQRQYAELASLTADDLRNIAERILDPAQSTFNDCAIVPKGTQLTGFDKLTLNA